MTVDKTLGIGAVAKRSGVKISTLHFYEEVGLIKSYRNSGNQRRYQRDVLRRIGVIKVAKKVGLTLEEIKASFSTLPEQRTPNVKDWDKLAKSWKSDLNDKIKRLESLRDSLTGCIGCGCLSLKKCPIYNADDQLSSKGDGAVLLNVND